LTKPIAIWKKVDTGPNVTVSNQDITICYGLQVTNMLENLDAFLKRTEPEIESITGEERDTASFMKMMRLFNEVIVNLHFVR
jgi:hypothetical protein